MSYSGFLLLFLGVPIMVLVPLLRRQLKRHQWQALALVTTIAFVYTTPWDNYAASRKLWSFAPSFVWGRPFWFGSLPLEEYLFYLLEAVFVCLVLLALSRVKALRPE